MKTISTYDFKNKRALIRVDFNVPLDKETMEVTDATRIIAAIPTINKVLDGGGSVVLMSHLGRPKNIPEDHLSLRHILPAIEEHLGKKVMFATDCIGERSFEQSANLKPGEILLLENLRFHQRESKGGVTTERVGDVVVG
jgi:phosphoglycerate kinase